MKKYRVCAKCVSYAYLDVEAESAEAAERIADETDGGEFIPTPDGEWEIMDATTEVE